MIFFADVPNPPPTFMGNWFFAVCAFVGLFAAILGVASYFATRREVDRLQDQIEKQADKITELERALTEKISSEVTNVHNRVNDVLGAVNLTSGKIDAFTSIVIQVMQLASHK